MVGMGVTNVSVVDWRSHVRSAPYVPKRIGQMPSCLRRQQCPDSDDGARSSSLGFSDAPINA